MGTGFMFTYFANAFDWWPVQETPKVNDAPNEKLDPKH
jgi:hypothetical protein